jgi:3-oxoacyl-[acyl-carrier protein] reductase
MKIDLDGKTAVVTGATGQLGRTMARSLASCGANVAVCYYRNLDFAEKLRAEIEQNYGVRSCAVCVDIARLDSVLEMKQVVNQALGPVEIIINNAVSGLSSWTSVLEQPVADYEASFRSAVLHNVHMAKAFVPDMISRRYGRVIGINTELAMQCQAGHSARVAGKRGLDGVLRVLAREVGPYQITVNQVAPGWTISDRTRAADGTEKNTGQDFPYIDRVPMHRRGTDQEIANAVCFLASDLAGFITGVYLPVCGGNIMPSI